MRNASSLFCAEPAAIGDPGPAQLQRRGRRRRRRCGRAGGCLRVIRIEDRRELEIDDAEPPVGGAVRDVPHVRIVVPDAVRFELVEQAAAASRRRYDRRARRNCSSPVRACSGSNRRTRGTKSQPRCSRYRRTRISFSNRSLRIGGPELLVDGPVVADADQSAGGVFGVVHEGGFRIQDSGFRE